MARVTARLERRVRTDFATKADAVLALLKKVPEQVPGGQTQDAERLQAALILGAHDDVRQVALRVVTAATDWRDLLIGCGLADADWPKKLRDELEPPRRPWLRSRPTGKRD